MSDAAQHGPAKRRTGIPRDLPDQEAGPGGQAEEDSEGGEQLPDTDEAGSGPRRPGGRGGPRGKGDREPPEPVEPTD
jgi:hypothetical protein